MTVLSDFQVIVLFIVCIIAIISLLANMFLLVVAKLIVHYMDKELEEALEENQELGEIIEQTENQYELELSRLETENENLRAQVRAMRRDLRKARLQK